MRESQNRNGNGPRPGQTGEPGERQQVGPVDRSHLLRRSRDFPFALEATPPGWRLRRSRRVSGSFRGIRSLSRNND